MAYPVTIIGAATSAGAHHAGQERAPAVLRAAGFVDRLSSAGLDVEDLGDVAEATFRPDTFDAAARQLGTVVDVARSVADAVDRTLAAGRLPIVLGGDCTITIGVVAGVQQQHPGGGLLYFDGDADLATPQDSPSGVLDAMGIAHLIGLTDNPLARLGAGWPMLSDRRVVLFGHNEGDPETNRPDVLRARPELHHFSDTAVRENPSGRVAAALGSLVPASDGIVVHFDVDAVDSRDLPLGNFPHYGTGLTLATAAECLLACCRAPLLRAVVLTEINPSYDPTGQSLARYVDAVTAVLGDALTAP
jgi:arginase